MCVGLSSFPACPSYHVIPLCQDAKATFLSHSHLRRFRSALVPPSTRCWQTLAGFTVFLFLFRAVYSAYSTHVSSLRRVLIRSTLVPFRTPLMEISCNFPGNHRRPSVLWGRRAMQKLTAPQRYMFAKVILDTYYAHMTITHLPAAYEVTVSAYRPVVPR